DGEAKHYAVELFLGYFLEPELISIFGRMRRKRHTLEYDTIGITSPADANNASRCRRICQTYQIKNAMGVTRFEFLISLKNGDFLKRINITFPFF
ncbi:MAG: hypothetical protein CVV34_02710, partial [Methanomicrobiales archaeon HGW-Methanomicrobiales-5]